MPVVAAIIELCTAAFSRLMASQLGRWVVQAMLFLGISFVSTKITSGAVTPALQGAFSGVGGDVLAWIAYLNVDRALTIILSAYAAVASTRFALRKIPKAST